MNRGTLTKNEDGGWMIKYSDTHAFMYGDIWNYLKVPLDTDTSLFKEGMKVNFEMVITGFDSENYRPFSFAKIIEVYE